MKVHVLVPAVLCAMAAAGCGGTSEERASAPEMSAATSVDDTSVTAAHADDEWIAALERKGVSAGAVLDADFEWTNSDGLTRTRAEALQHLQALADELRGEGDARRYHYGRVHVVTSGRPGARMMRVWTLRPEGWRARAVISTALTTGAAPFAATDAATGDCDNPCRTMPYTPRTENEKQIAAIFQRLKVDEWHPDPDGWAPYVLDDVYYVTATAQLSKADRLARLTKLKETGAPSVPGDPVTSMRIEDLGDSAIMTARHDPYRGGRPYYSLRVWAFQDGRWQLANTQQTAIGDAPPAAAR